MKKRDFADDVPLETLQERVLIMRDLFDLLKDELHGMIVALNDDDAPSPDVVMAELFALETVHIWLVKAEGKLNDQTSDSARYPDIDFDELREDLARQFDRLAQAQGSE